MLRGCTPPLAEAGIGHRAELVDPATERGEDSLDRVAELLLGSEPHLGALHPPASFDVDPVGPVDQHVLDLGVGEQLLERPEPDRITEDQLRQLGATLGGQDRRLALDQLSHRRLQTRRQRPAGGGLGAAQLSQPPPKLGGERLGVCGGVTHLLWRGAGPRTSPPVHRLDTD